MTHDAIIERVAELLDQHHRGIRGALRQTEYLRDLFRLFADAYWQAKDNPSGPCITGDGLLDDIAERWQLDDSEDSERRRTLLRRFCSIWDEWQFAWDHYESPRA